MKLKDFDRSFGGGLAFIETIMVGMAKIQCTICGDWVEWGTIHKHNPDNQPKPTELPYTFEDEDEL